MLDQEVYGFGTFKLWKKPISATDLLMEPAAF
jgi:hypothetical protein